VDSPLARQSAINEAYHADFRTDISKRDVLRWVVCLKILLCLARRFAARNHPTKLYCTNTRHNPVSPKELFCPQWFLFANQGEFTTGDYEEIMNKASSLILISNAILSWNASRMQNNVCSLRNQGDKVEDKTLSHISLLPYKHVLPNGTYFNDIEIYKE
jgi:hypothetical protein